MPTPAWFIDSLGWKDATDSTREACLADFGVPRGPNLADLSGPSSRRISGTIYEALGIAKSKLAQFDLGSFESLDSDSGRKNKRLQAAGTALEEGLKNDLLRNLQLIDPDRKWDVLRTGNVGDYAQFYHLRKLQELFESSDELRSSVGRDYQVKSDLFVSLPGAGRDARCPILHAAVSSKLTLRSDRAQNVRVEFGTLVRNRRGRLPHLVVVTAEPTPGRLKSLTRGTGEIDAVYHLLFDQLDEAVRSLDPTQKHCRDQLRDWNEMVSTGRMKPYSDLAEILAAG